MCSLSCYQGKIRKSILLKYLHTHSQRQHEDGKKESLELDHFEFGFWCCHLLALCP